ncbi:hypothetical protein [Flavobacterium sp. MDT1-60]|uniref:hypothetical protein n=1 Tax=Flavobacterium sp. MDT1-60 TaxID=1979344 RepID=UPI0017815AAF|nr:hypothetical protein [Flavobacterium sp. MDT1-60]QOG03790.1 hypothetical protein IHE43_06060 [Flavobacterium sp. MDT1-60]
MVDFNLVMIATHQNELNIFKLIDSVNRNVKNIKVLLLVVSQECEISYQPTRDSSLSIVFINEVKMGLSKARNIALRYLSDKNISSEYIMFPDDDSSFDDFFFLNFFQILKTDKCYITPIFNEGSQDLYFGKRTPDGKILTPLDHQLIGSPNQIILYDKLKSKIIFDEKLGVGAIYGSSEDIDLFIKLFNTGEQFVFINNIYTYHPKKIAAYKNTKFAKIIKRFESYSNGFAYIIFKYRLYGFIPEYLIRTFGAFIVFTFKLQFKLAFAYLLQFFIRIKILITYFFNRNLYRINE